MCGSLLFVDEAAEDRAALGPLLGEVGDGFVGPELAAARGLSSVVVRAYSAGNRPQVAFTEDQHQVGDLGPGGEQEPFRIGIRARASGAGSLRRPLWPGPSQASNQVNMLVEGLRGRCPRLSAFSPTWPGGPTDIWRTGPGAKSGIGKKTAGQEAYSRTDQAVCKTVGLAYVGSNPTPATT
jgi:hypothetical protein